MVGERGKKKKERNPNQLTPYQGPHRSFGYFKCTQCEKTWSSAYSWANCSQECSDCLIKIYPFRQRKLEKSKKKAEKKPHLQNLCQKCQDLGAFCGDSSTRTKRMRSRGGKKKAVAE